MERRVLVTAHSLGDDINGLFIHLRNPKSGTPGCYLLMNNKLQELNWFKPRYSSWFIGDSVCEDGSLYMASVVDPLFMVLPLLEESRMKKRDDGGMFRSLEDILFVEGYPCYSRIRTLLSDVLDVICDVREVGGSRYYRVNDSMVLGWLCCKVKQTAEALKAQDGFENLGETDRNAYTIGLLGEYLKSDPWLKRLCDHFSVDLDASKKWKMPGTTPLPVPSEPVTAKTNAPASKKLKKAAAGSGSSKITSFFARPR